MKTRYKAGTQTFRLFKDQAFLYQLLKTRMYIIRKYVYSYF